MSILDDGKKITKYSIITAILLVLGIFLEALMCGG